MGPSTLFIRNINNYVSDVAYGDTQRFRWYILFEVPNIFFCCHFINMLPTWIYNDQGKISLYFGSERDEVHNTVLVWGCVSSLHPKALLLQVSEKFNSATYKEILQKIFYLWAIKINHNQLYLFMIGNSNSAIYLCDVQFISIIL
jgi:hypothetical protein